MSLLKRISIATTAVALAGILGLSSVARADCPACSTALLACGQGVVAAFQSCISTARTRTATQACIATASQGLSMCQANFSACIATCTPAK